MKRVRRGMVVAAAVAAAVAVVTSVAPTRATWVDPMTSAVPMSSGTWAAPGPPIKQGGIAEGNEFTEIENIVWDTLGANSFCTTVHVTGASATPQDWRLTVDLDSVPFRGFTAGQISIQRGVGTAGPDNTLIVTGKRSNSHAPFNVNSNNTPITNQQHLTVQLCMYWGPTPQGDPSWYTTQVTQGAGTDWSNTRACMTLTVATTQTDLAVNPFYYGWMATLDMSAAIARIQGSGHTVDQIIWPGVYPNGSDLTSSPGPGSNPSGSYALTSGTPTALRAQGSGRETATVVACAVDY